MIKIAKPSMSLKYIGLHYSKFCGPIYKIYELVGLNKKIYVLNNEYYEDRND